MGCLERSFDDGVCEPARIVIDTDEDLARHGPVEEGEDATVRSIHDGFDDEARHQPLLYRGRSPATLSHASVGSVSMRISLMIEAIVVPFGR